MVWRMGPYVVYAVFAVTWFLYMVSNRDAGGAQAPVIFNWDLALTTACVALVSVILRRLKAYRSVPLALALCVVSVIVLFVATVGLDISLDGA